VRDAHPALPEGMTLRSVRGDLPARIDAEFHRSIGRAWGSYARFAAEGFGVCALDEGGAVAGIALAVAVGAGCANVDIETAVAYRHRGLATHMGAAFIAACHERGLVPTWEADVANTASLATARRLGFVPDADYSRLSPPDGSTLDLSHGLSQGQNEEEEEGVPYVVRRWQRVNDEGVPQGLG